MSMNLVIPGCPYPICQTTSDFTYKWHNKSVIETLPAYKAEYLDSNLPKPLNDKDSRNPFLVAAYEAEVAEVTASYDKLRFWVLANPQIRWMVR